MPDFLSAPVQKVYPKEAGKLRSLKDFIPVHQYPFGYEVGHGEVGMIATLKGEDIIDIQKRIFYKDFHV